MPDFGGVLAALGGAFSGYAAAKKRRFEQQRALAQDEENRIYRSAQMEDLQARAADRLAQTRARDAEAADRAEFQRWVATPDTVRDIAASKRGDADAHSRLMSGAARFQSGTTSTFIQNIQPFPKDPVAVHAANRQFDVEHPAEDRTLVAVQNPNKPGENVYVTREQAQGMQPAKTGTAKGTASLIRAAGNNRARIAQIDQVIAEIRKNPAALGGIVRGTAEFVPGAGKVVQRLEQEVPGHMRNVQTQSKVGNISALVIHDRYGSGQSQH